MRFVAVPLVSNFCCSEGSCSLTCTCKLRPPNSNWTPPPPLPHFSQFFKTTHLSVSAASKEYFQQLRRHNYVTPTSFLELLGTFKVLLKAKRQDLRLAKDRIRNGLEKLTHTASQVSVLQVRGVGGAAPRCTCSCCCCTCSWGCWCCCCRLLCAACCWLKAWCLAGVELLTTSNSLC